jgi:hypothetical protein
MGTGRKTLPSILRKTSGLQGHHTHEERGRPLNRTASTALSAVECLSQTVRGLGGGDGREKDHGATIKV